MVAYGQRKGYRVQLFWCVFLPRRWRRQWICGQKNNIVISFWSWNKSSHECEKPENTSAKESSVPAKCRKTHVHFLHGTAGNGSDAQSARWSNWYFRILLWGNLFHCFCINICRISIIYKFTLNYKHVPMYCKAKMIYKVMSFFQVRWTGSRERMNCSHQDLEQVILHQDKSPGSSGIYVTWGQSAWV